MAFPSKVKTLDELPESDRQHFVPGDDGFFHAEILDDGKKVTYTAKARTLATVLTEKKDLEATIAPIKAIIGDRPPEQVKALIEQGGAIDQRIAAAVEEVRKKEVSPLNDRLTTLNGELTVERRDRIVSEALDKAGVIPERKKAAMNLALERVKLQQDGKLVVMGDDGNPSIYSAEQWVASDFRKANDYLFAGTQGGGSGAADDTPARPAPATTPPASPAGGKPKVNVNDPSSFLANLGAVAKGEAQLVSQ